jgi:DNA-binding MarR family transcriptional regulator
MGVKKKTTTVVKVSEFASTITPDIKQRLLTQLSAIYRDTLIVFSYQQEATITKIAEEMGLDKSTVSRIVKKWKEETQK